VSSPPYTEGRAKFFSLRKGKTMITKTITVYDFSRFESKLAGLNKKAAKAGLPPVVVGTVKDETKWIRNRFDERVEVFSHYEVELELAYEYVRFPGGWSLVGVIDHFENLVRSVPDMANIPLTPFVERGAVCDHCGFDRNRKETFIVVDKTGRILQVGRQCVGLLLGVAPERVLAQVDLVREVLEDEEWLGSRQVRGMDLGFYLSHVAAMIRTAGWRSATATKQEGGASTAGLAEENITLEELKKKGRYGEQLWVDRTDSDRELAGKVVLWLEALGGRRDLNDYQSNLVQIGKNGFVTPKSRGFAASAVAAYQKDVERVLRAVAEREGKVAGGYVGSVGERISFKATLVKSFGFDTEWGYSFIHKFVDEAGNTLTWRTATALDQDAAYNVRATVKAQEEYKGEKQTAVTRAIYGKV
jgi:hypothetical protein